MKRRDTETKYKETKKDKSRKGDTDKREVGKRKVKVGNTKGRMRTGVKDEEGARKWEEKNLR